VGLKYESRFHAEGNELSQWAVTFLVSSLVCISVEIIMQSERVLHHPIKRVSVYSLLQSFDVTNHCPFSTPVGK